MKSYIFVKITQKDIHLKISNVTVKDIFEYITNHEKRFSKQEPELENWLHKLTQPRRKKNQILTVEEMLHEGSQIHTGQRWKGQKYEGQRRKAKDR